MATKKKLLQAAAGVGGAEALNVEDVFSTYLYEGVSGAHTITNGIDLAGEGGMVWIKNRGTDNHSVLDTERGQNLLMTNQTLAEQDYTNYALSFNSDGFTTGSLDDSGIDQSGYDYASWTFRKAPKFFDVVTYTGNGTAGRTVSHNLGSVPACIFIKCTNTAKDWIVYHTSLGNTKYLELNTTTAAGTDTYWNNTTPTDSVFTLGSSSPVNGSGNTYVAYLFAHNDGDGEFGPNGDADIIKCGSIDTGATGKWTENLGFEPQWILLKRSDNTGGWFIYDAVRGITSGGNDAYLYASSSSSETTSGNYIELTPTGFKNDPTDGTNRTYIYIAIRRGPMAVPESASEVFAIDTAGGTSPTPPTFLSGFPVDFHFYKSSASALNWLSQNRLTGSFTLSPNVTDAEVSNTGTYFEKDYMNGVGSNTGSSSSAYQWMWKRAPSFFDVVAYKGTDVYGSDIAHNLGVAPEMIWVKNRNRGDSAAFWAVYHKDLTATDYLKLNATSATATSSGWWADTEPTATHFTIGNQASVNSTDNFIAYLFASLDGVSKVGSYTGNGSTQTIDCGFSSGARFILIKRTDSTGDWYIWDTERGIVVANDPHLSLNSTAAEVTTDDSIDPVSSGFAVNQVAATNINVSSASYIYYAVA